MLIVQTSNCLCVLLIVYEQTVLVESNSMIAFKYYCVVFLIYIYTLLSFYVFIGTFVVFNNRPLFLIFY